MLGRSAIAGGTSLEAVRGGMRQAAAASSFGVSLRAVSKWMRMSREGGVRALKPGKRADAPAADG
jgi:transposase